MVAIKAGQVANFLKTIDNQIVAVLVYGPDTGSVSERARTIAASLAARSDPPGEIVRLDDNDLEQNPDRLAIELQTVAMFGGAKVVRTSASRKVTTQTLKPFLEADAMTGTLVVEAGNLRADDSLRKLFEKPAHAAAIPCYTDDVRDLDALLTEILKRDALTIDREARQLALSRIGADRALSRSEIEKLALYALGNKTVTVSDVEAIVGDASEMTFDKIILPAASGNAAKAITELDRSISSGESAQTIITLTQRHFQRLHRIRADMDRGKTFDDATRRLRPALHFKIKSTIQQQAQTWSLGRLNHALAMISATAKAARLNSALEQPLTERLLLDLSNLVARAPPR